jgi:SAGA-associated factor 11
MVDQPGVDIYGQRVDKSASESFPCNNCQQVVVASRYAPHLEKCMGMGRNSSRLARRYVGAGPVDLPLTA